MRKLKASEEERVHRLRTYLQDVALLELTPTGLKKSIMDATEAIRGLLKRSGVHDYAKQKQGQKHKVLVPAKLATGAGFEQSKASLYRPTTKKGDPRIWFSRLDKCAKGGDVLVVFPHGSTIYVVNVTRLPIERLINETSHHPLRQIVEEARRTLAADGSRRNANVSGWVEDTSVVPKFSAGDSTQKESATDEAASAGPGKPEGGSIPVECNDFVVTLLDYSAERDAAVAGPDNWDSSPLAIDTPLFSEMRDLADELWARHEHPIWYFLVGGPGNGKSEAVGAFVQRLNENAQKAGKPPVIVAGRGGGRRMAYSLNGNIGNRPLRIIQDISVPREAGSDPARNLLEDLFVSRDAHVLACANRGMLLRATRIARDDYRSLVPILVEIDKRTREDASANSARWKELDPEVHLRVWPLDHESVLFGAVDRNPWADPSDSLLDQLVRKAVSEENWERKGCSQCRAATLCPMYGDALWLRQPNRRHSALKIFRAAETLSGQRLVLREALGMLSLVLVGTPSDFGAKHPCEWVASRVIPAEPAEPRDKLSLIELVSHRIYQDLFGRAAPCGIDIDDERGERDAWVLEGIQRLGEIGKEVTRAVCGLDEAFAKDAGPQRIVGISGILSPLDPARDASWCRKRSITADGMIEDLRKINAEDQGVLEHRMGDLFQQLEEAAGTLKPHENPAWSYAALYRWASTLYLRLSGTVFGESCLAEVLENYLSLIENPAGPVGPRERVTTLRDLMQAAASGGERLELAPGFTTDPETFRLQPIGARARSITPRWPANDRVSLQVRLSSNENNPTLIMGAAVFLDAWEKHFLASAEWNIAPAIRELLGRWREDFVVFNNRFNDVPAVRFDGAPPLEFEFLPGQVQVRRGSSQ